MLTIRREQFVVLRRAAQATAIERLIDRAVHYLARGRDELRPHVESVVARAHEYGLESEDDLRRFLDLALEHGWDFERAPAAEWMRARLHDAAVTSPSARLTRLIDELDRREAIKRHNRKLADQFRGGNSRG